MKQLALLLLVVITYSSASAQKIAPSKVPSKVGAAFRAKFPATGQDSWAMAKSDVYEVVFFNARKRQSAQFDTTGKWLQTENELDYTQLPGPVSKSLNKQFANFQIQEAYLVDTYDKGTIYIVSVFKGKENYEVTFSAKGEVLSKEAGKEEE